MTDDQRKKGFHRTLALHLTEKMAATGTTYGDLARDLRLDKNYLFRASKGEDQNVRPQPIHISSNLLKVLDWCGLEPRDFATSDKALPGHLAQVILAQEELTQQQRIQLLEVVHAFLKTAVREG